MQLLSRDVSYGPELRHRLDIFRPISGDQSTVIIFWHGGSWRSGDKKTYQFMGRSLAKLGYTVVIPNYRLYPSVKFPAFIEDAARAIAWVHTNIMPTKLVTMGHSAGAHIAVVVTLDPRYVTAAGAGLNPIQGCIGLAGPYDFDPHPSLKPIFTPFAQQSFNPVNLVRPKPVPMLLMAGRLDAIVYPWNTPKLAEKLREAGGTVTLKMYAGLEHFTILAPFVTNFILLPSMKRYIKTFIGSLS